jgi:TorA maturation chaperone TorD
MQDVDQERGAARETLCRLLAACYYEPGPEFEEEQVFDSMLDAASRLHPELAAHARRLGAGFSVEKPESLLIDYTRLFLGPNHIIAKPYGSVWIEGENALMQESTMAIEELYAEGGFELDENFRELPDHIAAELEFLYLLIYRENEARRNDDTEALTAIAGLRKRLLEAHLGCWIGPFTAAISAGAQSEFYRALAALTGRFVQMEAAVEPVSWQR